MVMQVSPLEECRKIAQADRMQLRNEQGRAVLLITQSLCIAWKA